MTKADDGATIYDLDDARAFVRDGDREFRDAGGWLASMREESGISIADAAARTHIKERHLRAIETLDIEALPARPYALGFVRAYAHFLGLDGTQAAERFKLALGEEGAEEKRTFAPDVKTTPASESIEKPELSLYAVVAIVAFAIWCVFQLTLPKDVQRLGARTPAGDEVSEQVVAPPPPEPETVIPAKLTERVEAIYPIGCVSAAAPQETVTIAFTVSPRGRVIAERVARSTNACFDAAALNAVRRWRYEPRTIDGKRANAFDQTAEIVFDRPA